MYAKSQYGDLGNDNSVLSPQEIDRRVTMFNDELSTETRPEARAILEYNIRQLLSLKPRGMLIRKADKDGNYEYDCLMAIIDDESKAKILKWNKANIPDNVMSPKEKGREVNPHVTVLYGLTKDFHEDIFEKIKETRPELKLGEIDIFEKDEYDVVKVNVISDDLTKLHHYVDIKYDSNDEFDIYKPHLTLAYVKKGEGKKYVGNKDLEKIDCKIVEYEYTTHDDKEYHMEINASDKKANARAEFYGIKIDKSAKNLNMPLTLLLSAINMSVKELVKITGVYTPVTLTTSDAQNMTAYNIDTNSIEINANRLVCHSNINDIANMLTSSMLSTWIANI
jgi:2'-5' RNA ligase